MGEGLAFLKRNNLSHINLLKELKLEPGDWYSYLHMDSEAYLEICQKVKPRLRKCECNEMCYRTT
jgi:hypothetical protein